MRSVSELNPLSKMHFVILYKQTERLLGLPCSS